MAAPEESIRNYLDQHGGTVEVSVRQALSGWRLDRPSREERERVARELAAAGIECDPPLVEGELESRVTLRVREAPRDAGPTAGATAPGRREEATAERTQSDERAEATPRGEEPAAAGPPRGEARSSRGRDLAGRLGQTGGGLGQGAKRAGGGLAQGAKRAGARVAAFNPPGGDRALVGALVAGGVGSLIALGPDSIYGYGLGLGVLALALLVAARGGEPRPAPADDAWAARLPWVAGGLAALALLLGVLGSLTIETVDLSTQAGTETADRRERDAFCASEGDDLARLSLRGTRSADALRDATDAVLDIAEDAPPGTNCAVLALDAVADAWIIFGGFPEYDDAGEQVERIRELQEERGLREPVA
ncbi:MAG: hypothetical protein MSC31_03220 [Solirubrobacteraceae bacterium MAG38_C4-C5]|nr:hypothetical protein [Candidatus Siliceabacter maunaloa]